MPDEPPTQRDLDVLIPTCDRPAELAVTLAGLAVQDGGFGVVGPDQSDGTPAWGHGAAAGLVRILRPQGHPVRVYRNLPRRGGAEHRPAPAVPARGPYM